MEMQHCIQCICQHHEAKDMYSLEYELSSIGPLLDVLRRLDEERVTQYLRNINHRISQNEYAAAQDNTEVVSIVYEVCPFLAPSPSPPSITYFSNTHLSDSFSLSIFSLLLLT